MAISPYAGQVARTVPGKVPNINKLRAAFWNDGPDISDPRQLVGFGTSGHRGRPDFGTFNLAHIEAIAQATVEFNHNRNPGPVYFALDSHALSLDAMKVVLGVFAANRCVVKIEQSLRFDDKGGFTPTPALSYAVIQANRRGEQATGMVGSPSHNPPEDGGIKFNPPHGGPADMRDTNWIQARANEFLWHGNRGVKRMPFEQALESGYVQRHDFLNPYVRALAGVIDFDVIKKSQVRIGADALGGAALEYYQAIKEAYGLEYMDVLNAEFDNSFAFMHLDHDGKIRMDCSSEYAMAGLIGLKDRYDVACGADTDGDRHGVVTRLGILKPNYYLSLMGWYLLNNRPDWPRTLGIGQTCVTTSMLTKIAKQANRRSISTPVGFKYAEPEMRTGAAFMFCEESAGAVFLDRSGRVFVTEKCGIISGLLAAEMRAKTGKDLSALYWNDLGNLYGQHFSTRADAAMSESAIDGLATIDLDRIKETTLGGDKIIRITNEAPNGEKMGGILVYTEYGSVALRGSGTEKGVLKVYGESTRSQDHLDQLIKEAPGILARAFK